MHSLQINLEFFNSLFSIFSRFSNYRYFGGFWLEGALNYALSPLAERPCPPLSLFRKVTSLAALIAIPKSMNTNDRNGRMPVLDFFSDGCFQQIKDILENRHLLKMLVSLWIINRFPSNLRSFQSVSKPFQRATLFGLSTLPNMKIFDFQNLENRGIFENSNFQKTLLWTV